MLRADRWNIFHRFLRRIERECSVLSSPLGGGLRGR